MNYYIDMKIIDTKIILIWRLIRIHRRNRITTVEEILNARNYFEYEINDCQLPPRSTSVTCYPKYRQMKTKFTELQEKSKTFTQGQKSSEIITEKCFIPVKPGVHYIVPC